MNSVKINKFLIKGAEYAGYGLAVLMFLYLISGYGSTKGIIDPVLAKSLHEKWLPLPTFIFFTFHFLGYFRLFLKRHIKQENWVDFYLVVLGLIILAICFYLYFL